MGHGFGLTGISSMLFVLFLLSVLWLSSLRGVRSCGGRLGLGFRLRLLRLFVCRPFIMQDFLGSKMDPFAPSFCDFIF